MSISGDILELTEDTKKKLGLSDYLMRKNERRTISYP